MNIPKKYMQPLVIMVIFIAFFIYTDRKNKKAQSNRYQGIDLVKPNSQYWSFKGKRTLLLGGSKNDNLFQSDNLEEHLDLLTSVGGNYVRNTMSSSDEGDLWPFAMQEDGLYDLNKWNDEYWNKFDNFLKLTSERDIVVQIEIWATFSFYRDVWERNPFNPKNNINYDEKRSKLSAEVKTHPVYTENNFFRSVPSQMCLIPVLNYQQKFVDKILSYSLNYDNVLYCIDNETSVTSDWGKFWAEYLHRCAFEKGRKVYVTEMWDPWELTHAIYNETYYNPELFSYIEISQNNHQSGQKHWDEVESLMKRLEMSKVNRPINNVKVYGYKTNNGKNPRNGVENFVKNVLVGSAAVRFHRPLSGLGLNDTAQNVIKGMRDLTEKMNFINAKPHNDMLKGREEDEAYCRAVKGMQYAIFFTHGGEVALDLSTFRKTPSIYWLDLLSNEWSEPTVLVKSDSTIIKCPEGKDWWIALIKKEPATKGLLQKK